MPSVVKAVTVKNSAVSVWQIKLDQDGQAEICIWALKGLLLTVQCDVSINLRLELFFVIFETKNLPYSLALHNYNAIIVYNSSAEQAVGDSKQNKSIYNISEPLAS